ncbi:hypothetical protein L210DRAFT_2769356 [Boletus edulis BED1]|uniref:Uncharacterized protein n=1 Tax=Boletus edulis BED1 TaxID=1328754 RepID=A0AAD4GA26_BOLED|nr:hypothetical protein L210DRAFT_2982230 [Boletus edulis BED1]KAF8432793.1 hypothetical protein L210DRAFT_2769356 [Boletus edulis BED1]
MTKRGAGFILLLTKDLARRAKSNPSASLGIFFGAFSALFTITRAILLSRNQHPGGYIDFFGDDCLKLASISILASLMVVGGDRHQRTAYKHVFFMSAISTKLITLASWTMHLWFPDRPRISLTLFVGGVCLWYIAFALGWFTGHLGKLAQAKTFVSPGAFAYPYTLAAQYNAC